MKRVLAVAGMVVGCAAAGAQWTLQESHTTASLRGVHSVDGKVAWASGSGGTVLRTVDAGAHWQVCAVPPEGEKLDFRGVQAFDAQTAIVMSSGKGDLSRLYKTTDGCGTWKLVFTNPDAEGFFDAVYWDNSQREALVIGDPVDGQFVIFSSSNNLLEHWFRLVNLRDSPSSKLPAPRHGEALFAASNSNLQGNASDKLSFITGGVTGSRYYSTRWHVHALFDYRTLTIVDRTLPFKSSESAGAFAMATTDCGRGKANCTVLVVGGDYRTPNDAAGTAAYSSDNGDHWHSPNSTPGGYRSSVAFDRRENAWVTVGPNGTDVSTDDGQNWRALKPGKGEPPGADKNWNALSLPFVVGSKGRIGVLRADAVRSAGK